MVAAAALAATVFVPAISRADLVSPPPPECVGHPMGTQCILDNGTAGTCTEHQDPRRPGRTNVTCEPDTHECDRLAVGAECHGYLRRPSHCREYTNDRNEHWRACMNDETAASAPASPAPSNAATAPPTNASPTDNRVVAPQTAPASAGRRCSASPALPSETTTVGVLAALAAAGTVLARRRRKA